MKVEFSPVSFKSNTENKPAGKGRVNLQSIAETVSDDAYTPESEFADVNSQSVKKGSSVNEGIAKIWKFFSVANQMANAALKGLFYGAVTGFVLLSGSWLFRALPKAFTKEGPKLWVTICHPLKHIPKSGKVIAGVSSGSILAYHLIKGKLQANQNTAVIDHKLKVGHRDV